MSYLSSKLALALAVVALGFGLGPTLSTSAQGGPVVLRIATLAPVDSPIGRGFQELDAELNQRSNGQVRIRLYGGGAAGDERTVVRKLRDGQLDGAALTGVGLGAIAREVLVLQAPGLIGTYAELDRVRQRMQPGFDRAFAREGFTLLGWGDAGRIRVLSTHRIERPSDLRSARPWVWRDSPSMQAFIRATGATGVPLQVTEVLPGLSTGMIDTVLASSVSAIAMQWHGRLRTISRQANGVVVGGVVVRSDKLELMPEDIRTFLIEHSRSNESGFRRAGRRLDNRATRALFDRLDVVDMDGYRSAWTAAAERARTSLIGRIYTQSQIDRVRAILDAP